MSFCTNLDKIHLQWVNETRRKNKFVGCNIEYKWIISCDNHLTCNINSSLVKSKRQSGPKAEKEEEEEVAVEWVKGKERKKVKGGKSVRGLIKEHPNETQERQGKCEIHADLHLEKYFDLKDRWKKKKKSTHTSTHTDTQWMAC